MKEKIIAFVMAGMMVLSLAACGAKKDNDGTVNSGNGDVTDNNGSNNATDNNGGTANNGNTNNGNTNNGNTDNGTANNGTTNNGTANNGTANNGTAGSGDDTISGNAKGRTWDTDVRSGNSYAYGYDYDFDNNGGRTFGGIDQDNTVYDGMGSYRTNRTATWAQMLENGRVHDTDGFLLDGENTTW